MENENELSAFVNNHITINQTYAVEALLNCEKITDDDIENQYFLVCPVCGEEIKFIGQEKVGISSYRCESCGEERTDDPDEDEEDGESSTDFELQQAEVLEWWAIDSWLARELEQQGEVVISCGLGIWWGRTCSGKAIALDSVIKTIYNKFNQ